MTWDWILIEKNCTGCGICKDVCSYHAITMTPTMAYPEPVPSGCVGCMVCVDQRPFDALKVVRNGSTVPQKTRR